MKSTKCPRCGLVGWGEPGACKNCDAAGGGLPAGALLAVDPNATWRDCPECHAACARSAPACPRCGHAFTGASSLLIKIGAAALVPLLLVTLLAAWRYYRIKAAESALASQFGIVDTPVREEPQKPWFWSFYRSQPTAREVFEHYAEVGGGASSLKAVASQRVTGKVSFTERANEENRRPNAQGTLDLRVKSPDKALAAMEVKYYGGQVLKRSLRRGFDGTRGWEQDEHDEYEFNSTTPVAKREVRTLAGPDVEQLKRFAAVTGMTRPEDYYLSAEVVGQEKVGKDVSMGQSFGARLSYEVRARRRDGKTETLYFDVATGLLTRLDFDSEDEDGGAVPVECYLEDYREVGRVKLPFKLFYRVKDSMVMFSLDGYKLDAPADDSDFEMPAS